MSRRAPILLVALAVAATYFLLGRAALLLAIPPGYATAVWPSAGAALLAVLLWGRAMAPAVALGSLANNLLVADLTGGLAAAAAPVAIALGAAAQALLGAALIRRLVGFPHALDEAGPVTRFLALGGPIACLVNATVGVGALLAAGALPPEAAPFSWFTWWVGDTLGVVLVVPVGLAFFAQPAATWRARRRAVGVPLGIAAMSAVLLFVIASDFERRHQAAPDLRAMIHGDDGVARGSLRCRMDSAQGPAAAAAVTAIGRAAPEFPVRVGGERWRLRLSPAHVQAQAARSWRAWTLLASLLAVTALLGGLLLVLTGRNARVQDLARRLAEEVDALSMANRELQRFGEVAAHDLRTPLRGLLRLATWLQRDQAERLDEAGREHLALLGGRVRRMDRLLDAVQQFTLARQLPHATEAVSIGPLVRELAGELKAPGLTLEVAADLPTLTTSRATLEQVFANLLGNAVTHHDGPAQRVAITHRRDGAVHRFTVCDDGPGIPAEHRPRAMEMFRTLRSRDDVDSSGMGLAIVCRLVESLGGRVTLSDNAPRGLCVAFDWPEAWPAQRQGAGAPLPGPPDGISRQGR